MKTNMEAILSEKLPNGKALRDLVLPYCREWVAGSREETANDNSLQFRTTLLNLMIVGSAVAEVCAPKWIRVEDGLPRLSKVRVGYWMDSSPIVDAEWVSCEAYTDCNGALEILDSNKFTHWMLLSEGPQI